MAARALIRLAECYTKLADPQSRGIYERVVRDYADQKEAVAMARAHLSNTSRNGGITTRHITNVGAGVQGNVSADGQYLPYTDFRTGDLALRDLVNGTDRLLTNKGGSFVDSKDVGGQSAISRDGKQVAYSWFNEKLARYELRLVSTAAGTNPPRLLYANEEVPWIGPYDWSADGKRIAVQLQRKDRSQQLGVIDVTNGSLRVVKSTGWQASTGLWFSPDGAYIAFDNLSDDFQQRDIFVLATDGSREIPAVVHPANDTVIGWTVDGKALLFASDRGGTTGIWALPFSAGKFQGSPRLIKSDAGRVFSVGGPTPSGSLYFGLSAGGGDVYVASVDFRDGKVMKEPAVIAQQFIGSNSQPDWSADGKSLAYKTTSSRVGDSSTLTIQSMDKGKIRTLRPQLSYFNFPRWSPDSKSFVVQATDLRGRQGIFRIDAETAETELIVLNGSSPQWSVDGRKIFYTKYGCPIGNSCQGRGNVLIVERDLASGNERELLNTKNNLDPRSVSLSPDGQYVAVVISDATTKQWALTVIPISGGEAHEIFHPEKSVGLGLGYTVWTPDSRSIVVISLAEGKTRMVSLSDSESKDIDFGRGIQGLRFQADGRVAFFKPAENASEIWVMENFLPALAPKQTAR